MSTHIRSSIYINVFISLVLPYTEAMFSPREVKRLLAKLKETDEAIAAHRKYFRDKKREEKKRKLRERNKAKGKETE